MIIVYSIEHIYNRHKKILNQPFPDEKIGYLAIIEIPNDFLYATVTSGQGLQYFLEEVHGFPYYYAWKVKELQKVTTWIDAMLNDLNHLILINKQEQLAMEISDHLPEVIPSLIIQDINPYQKFNFDP